LKTFCSKNLIIQIKGGEDFEAFEYVKNNGINLSFNYPYTSGDTEKVCDIFILDV
jgi:hypothetical protein